MSFLIDFVLKHDGFLLKNHDLLLKNDDFQARAAGKDPYGAKVSQLCGDLLLF